MNINNHEIGWNFDNSYLNLPEIFLSKINPVKVSSPELIIFNEKLSNDLNLDFKSNNNIEIAKIFAGNILPKGSECIAQAYAGHQFGYFTVLGDGRAVLLGEHINKENNKFDIQLKGSGKTPYSRNGDGRAALGPMLREYLISEAMHGLNIPTTRALAVVKTGEKVFREKEMDGAILTRIASSHIRIGTFQYAAMQGNKDILEKLLNYTIKRHHPEILENKGENKAIQIIEKLIEKQISLVVNWMRVGFIHGVLNTDNVSLAGETIDYGPCSYMDYYDPKTVFSSIDHQGRYSFNNQEIITHWNISRFAETLIPLIDNNEDKAIKIGSKIIDSFGDKFKSQWLKMMKNKLGLINDIPNDEKLIFKFLNWMEKNRVDYTNTFLYLMNSQNNNNDHYKSKDFQNIYAEWKNRIGKNKCSEKEVIKIMASNNPYYIPRNHIVEKCLYEATINNNMKEFNSLIQLYKNPYKKLENNENYQQPSSFEFTEKYKTFCGT